MLKTEGNEFSFNIMLIPSDNAVIIEFPNYKPIQLPYSKYSLAIHRDYEITSSETVIQIGEIKISQIKMCK